MDHFGLGVTVKAIHQNVVCQSGLRQRREMVKPGQELCPDVRIALCEMPHDLVDNGGRIAALEQGQRAVICILCRDPLPAANLVEIAHDGVVSPHDCGAPLSACARPQSRERPKVDKAFTTCVRPKVAHRCRQINKRRR